MSRQFKVVTTWIQSPSSAVQQLLDRSTYMSTSTYHRRPLQYRWLFKIPHYHHHHHHYCPLHTHTRNNRHRLTCAHCRIVSIHRRSRSRTNIDWMVNENGVSTSIVPPFSITEQFSYLTIFIFSTKAPGNVDTPRVAHHWHGSVKSANRWTPATTVRTSSTVYQNPSRPHTTTWI